MARAILQHSYSRSRPKCCSWQAIWKTLSALV